MIRALLAVCTAAAGNVACAKLLDVVSDVHYINLAEAVDRDRFMQTQLARLQQESGLRYHRFEAVSGKRDHSVQLMVARFKDGRDPRLLNSTKSLDALKAVLAAEMSHVRLWERIWRAPGSTPLALILEDDARIPSKLEQKMAWLPQIPEDSDMVMLGYYLMCYTDGNLTHPCKEDGKDWRNFISIQEAVHKGGMQEALAQGTTRFAGAHAYLIKVKSIPRLLRHVHHIRDQVLGNSSVPLKMMGTDYATDFDEDCRKYVRSPPIIQQAHDLYETQIPTRAWALTVAKDERLSEQKPDLTPEINASSPVLMGPSLLALFALLGLAGNHIRRVLLTESPSWRRPHSENLSMRSADVGRPASWCDSAQLIESGPEA